MLKLKYKQKYLKYKNKYLHIKSQTGGSLQMVLALSLSILLGPPQQPHAVILRNLLNEVGDDNVRIGILQDLLDNPPRDNDAKNFMFDRIIRWIHTLPLVQLEENMNYLRRTLEQISQIRPVTPVQADSLVDMVISLAILLTSNRMVNYEGLRTNMRLLIARHAQEYPWLVQPLTNMLTNLDVDNLKNSFDILNININTPRDRG